MTCFSNLAQLVLIYTLIFTFRSTGYHDWTNVTEDLLTDQTLHTIAVKTEGVLNSRPITYVSSSPDDFRAITPNDFLLPLRKRELGPIPMDDGRKLKRFFNKVNHTLDQLWRHFVKEMIPLFHPVTVKNGHKARKDLQVGDIVCVLETKQRGRWPLARVVKILPGKDGKTRVVELQESTYVGGKKLYEPRFYTRDIRSLMLVRRADSDEEGEAPLSTRSPPGCPQ